MSGGFTFKRCPCPPVTNEAGKVLACKRKHGSWYFAAETRSTDGKRRQVKRGGFATQADAQAALTAFAEAQNTGTWTDDRNLTVSEFLTDWLAKKVANGLRPTTERSYRWHITGYVTPVIGTLRLRDVRPPHVEEVLRLAAVPKEKGRTPGPATVRRIHATMRSAFASAKRARYIPYNPAVDVELPRVTRPHVQPWEADELGAFLDHCAADPLGPLYEVAAFTGLRRGELLGLRWATTSTSNGPAWSSAARSSSSGTPPTSARSRPPAARTASSTSMKPPSGLCSATSFVSSSNVTSGEPPGSTAATSSPRKTGHRCTPRPSRNASANSPTPPDCAPFGSTTCATGRPASCSPPASRWPS